MLGTSVPTKATVVAAVNVNAFPSLLCSGSRVESGETSLCVVLRDQFLITEAFDVASGEVPRVDKVPCSVRELSLH